MTPANKTTLALLVVTFAALSLTGCPKPQQPISGPPADLPSTQPVKLSLWTIWNAEPRKSALNDIVTHFEQQNPDIDIEVTNLEPDAYKTRIRVALGGNTPPDIYFVWSGQKMLHNFVRGGNVADITAHMDADDGQWRDCITPASLQPYIFDGKVRGVPYLLQCTFFFYNKDLFAQHGWQTPTTYAELIALCRRIKAAGIIPIALGNVQKWPAHHLPFVLTQRLMGKAASEAQYDPLGPGDYRAPEFTEALQMFADFAAEGFFNDSPNGTTRENARVLFYGGKASMFYTGTWDFARFSADGEAPEDFRDKWDFFNFPSLEGGKGDQHALAGSPDGYVISAASPHIAEAASLLRFMTSVEQAAQFVDKCQELVQVKGAVTEDNAGPRLQKYAEIVEAARTITPWMDTMMERSVAEEYMNGVQALLDGSMTPDQIMDNVRKRQARVKQDMLAASGNPAATGD